MALGFSTTSAPGFSVPSSGSSGYQSIPGLSLNTKAPINTQPSSTWTPTFTPNITPSTPISYTSGPAGIPGLSNFGSSSAGSSTAGILPSKSQPYGSPYSPVTTSNGGGYDPSIGAGNPLSVPNIPDAERVQAHIAEVVQASAARIGAMQSAVAQRAHAAQIGEMDQVTAEKLNREDELKIRAEQVSLNEQLKAVVAGTAGPSVAELQYQRTSEEAARQQMGYAAARGTGGNYGLAMREAAQNQGLIQAQQSQGAAELRAKEVAEARNQMASLQTAIRAADIAVATTEANYRQQANMFNAEQVNAAKIRQAELNTQVDSLNAQLGTQVSMFNAGQENQATIRQAELETQTNIANAGFQNSGNQFNAASQNSADQFNSNLASQIAATRANLQSSTDQFNSNDSRIREIAEKQRQQDIINRATDYNNQVTRDQAGRDFTSGENQKARDAAAAENEKNRAAMAGNSATANANQAQAAANASGKAWVDTVFTRTAQGGAIGGAPGAIVGFFEGTLEGGFGFSNAHRDAAAAKGAEVQAHSDDYAKKRAALIAAGKNPADYPSSQGGDKPDGSGNDRVTFNSAEEAAGPPADDGKRWYNPFSW
jgi:hypothetical protein